MHRLIAFGSIGLTAFIVLLLSSQLPETVASHFNAAGVPDSFMPRDGRMPFDIASERGAGGYRRLWKVSEK